MSLGDFPALQALHRDLERLHARETIASGSSRALLREGKDSTVINCPWLDESFIVSGAQREVVRQLLGALTDSRTPDVEERVLLRRAKATCGRLEELFAGHPAWGSLIVRGERPGTFRIRCPEE